MKNYLIGALGASTLLLSSLVYKNSKQLKFNDLPTYCESELKKIEVPILLYFFFSENSCQNCLKIIEPLNRLPKHFKVIGIVPASESRLIPVFRKKNNISFPIHSISNFKRYVPFFTPSLIGISPKGNTIFVLPVVPPQQEILTKYLDDLYSKYYCYFIAKNSSEKY